VNILTKIVLGLNILAAGAGIFFGISVIPGKVDEIKKEAESANADAATAKKGQRESEKKVTEKEKELQNKTNEASRIKDEFDVFKKGQESVSERLTKAEVARDTFKSEAAAAKLLNDQIQGKANELQQAKGKLAEYAGLPPAQQIRLDLARLAKLEAVPTKKPKKTRPKSKPEEAGLIGLIKFYNDELEYYVISVGADNGIKVGDKYDVYDANDQHLGNIEISRTQPLASIAVSQRGRPKPPAPFKNGDKVMTID